MNIHKINANNLRNDAHFQFYIEFRDLVAQYGAASLKIKPLFDDFLLLHDREDEALKKIVKSELTSKIRVEDRARDSIFRSIREITAAYIRHFNPLIKDAAVRIKIVIDTYGNIAEKPLHEETSAVYNIVQELKTNRADDLAAIRITDWVEEFGARNVAFETLVKQRISEVSARTNIVLRTARLDVDNSYRAIMKRLDALIEVEGPANYEQFVKTLNLIIDNYAVRHRGRRNHPPEAP